MVVDASAGWRCPPLGLSATRGFEVGDDDTATALGSGDVPVLATPRLIAWLEAATVDALAPALAAGSTSVGAHVDVQHLAATPPGSPVTVTATVTAVDGRTVTFDCTATHTTAGAAGEVARGLITRVVVDRQRFLSRLG